MCFNFRWKNQPKFTPKMSTILKQKNDAKPKRKLHPALEANKWKKGDIPNPSGRPKITPEQRKARELLLSNFPRYVVNSMMLPSSELLARLKDTSTPPYERLFLSSMFRGIKDGNVDVLLKIMNRILGTMPMVPDERFGPVGNAAAMAIRFAVPMAGGMGDAPDTGSFGPQIIVSLPSNGREVREHLVDAG